MQHIVLSGPKTCDEHKGKSEDEKSMCRQKIKWGDPDPLFCGKTEHYPPQYPHHCIHIN